MTEVNRHTDQELDKFYTRSDWPIRLMIDWWEAHGVLEGGEVIGEPCCGDGQMCDTITEMGYDVAASDIMPDERAVQKYDARQLDARLYPSKGPDVDAIITNPPYSAETGTAGDVLKRLVPLGVPVAALLRLTFLEPCDDRTALLAGDFRQSGTHILPRVEYDREQSDKANNPITSIWVTWNTRPMIRSCHCTVGFSACGELRVVPKSMKEAYKSQMRLF